MFSLAFGTQLKVPVEGGFTLDAYCTAEYTYYVRTQKVHGTPLMAPHLNGMSGTVRLRYPSFFLYYMSALISPYTYVPCQFKKSGLLKSTEVTTYLPP